MDADTDRIRRGSGRADESAEYVHAGATGLGGASVTGGIFGDISAGVGAVSRLAAVHAGHMDALHAHHDGLREIARHSAATAATHDEQEAINAATVWRSGGL